ncbi:hypothetical protein BH11PSE12_BH11PSE12_07660 [soil metagenome]
MPVFYVALYLLSGYLHGVVMTVCMTVDFLVKKMKKGVTADALIVADDALSLVGHQDGNCHTF